MCSEPGFCKNIRQPIARCFRPIVFTLLIHIPPPSILIWAIRPISQWLCTVAPVGISHEERDGFPPSPQRTLSQTWPLSPPDLTLKWPCKEYVLEQKGKTTRLKTPRRANENPYVHLIAAAVSVSSAELSTVYSTALLPNDKLCYVYLFIALSVFNSDWQLPTLPDIPSHLPASRSCLRYLHRAPVVFSNWRL